MGFIEICNSVEEYQNKVIYVVDHLDLLTIVDDKSLNQVLIANSQIHMRKA